MNPTPPLSSIPPNTNVPIQSVKKSSRGKIIFILAMIVLVLVFIGVGISISNRNHILKDGIEVTAVSTGKVHEGTSGSRRNRHTTYEARYTYEVNGQTYTITGNKDYKSATNIREGMKAQVRYLAEDPYQNEIVSEE